MAESYRSEKQYQANIGSHNQTINYGNIIPPTLTRNSENKKGVIGTRRLQLQFSNNICKPVFTGMPIKGEDGQPLMVKLIDRQSGEVVISDPEASARVEIVGLQSDFGVCLGDSWTREEFRSKIVTGKEGTKRLLTGNVTLDLKEGIGYVGIVGFSHTKKWKMKCAYRLGAIVADDDIGTQIREGFTESFVVKDRRLNLNQKHNPPILSDKVWRLHGIAKDGPFHHRLSDINIDTVEGFLEKLNTDPDKLRAVLGKGMSAIKWEALVAHVQTCKVDDRLHLKSTANFNEIHFHQSAILFDGSPSQRPCNNICPPETPFQENSNGGKSLISLETDELDSPRPVAPSQEIDKLDSSIPFVSSVWDESSMGSIVSSWKEPEHDSRKPVDSVENNELFKPYDHHEGHKHEKPSNLSSQMTAEPVNWEMLPTFQPWFDPLPFSVDDVPFNTQGIILESLNNPQKDGNGPFVDFVSFDPSYIQPLTGGGDFLIPISNELGLVSFDNDSTTPAVSFNSIESPSIKAWTFPELSRNINELYFPQAAVSSPNLLGMDSSS